MKKKFLPSIFSIVLAFVITSNADIIQITGVDNGSVEYVSIVGSSLYLGGSNYTGGVYTGLYNALDVTTNQAWLTYCIDPIGDINVGNQWNSIPTTGAQLATGTPGEGVLSTAAYGNSPTVTVQKYEMISYLADKYYYDLSSSNPMANSNNGSTAINDRSDLSLAFWEIARDYDGTQSSLNLSGGNFAVTSGSLSFAQSLIADAYSNHGSKIDMAVFCPTERPSQEFIAWRVPTVPEPGTLSLIGMSLLGLLGFAVSRKRK